MSAGHDMTCGTCGRTWNSDETPTPAARCPYEYDHADPKGWDVTIVIDGVRVNFFLDDEDEYHDSEGAVTDYILEHAQVFVEKVG